MRRQSLASSGLRRADGVLTGQGCNVFLNPGHCVIDALRLFRSCPALFAHFLRSGQDRVFDSGNEEVDASAYCAEASTSSDSLRKQAIDYVWSLITAASRSGGAGARST